MATHTGIDLYQCQFCTRTFKSHANMHNHKKKMHPNEWVRKYTQPSSSIAAIAASASAQVQQMIPPAVGLGVGLGTGPGPVLPAGAVAVPVPVPVPVPVTGNMLPSMVAPQLNVVVPKSLIEIPDPEAFDFASNSSVCPTPD